VAHTDTIENESVWTETTTRRATFSGAIHYLEKFKQWFNQTLYWTP
jgi:cell wall assembly regulator SMI1